MAIALAVMLFINLSFVATAAACDYDDSPDLTFKKEAADFEPCRPPFLAYLMVCLGWSSSGSPYKAFMRSGLAVVVSTVNA